jgi:hypothetical protein
MPTKAEITAEDALSINSSTANLNSNDTGNTNQNINGSVITLKSQIPTKIQPLKSQSVVNDKFSRFDGGEQQIIVSFLKHFLNLLIFL